MTSTDLYLHAASDRINRDLARLAPDPDLRRRMPLLDLPSFLELGGRVVDGHVAEWSMDQPIRSERLALAGRISSQLNTEALVRQVEGGRLDFLAQRVVSLTSGRREAEDFAPAIGSGLFVGLPWEDGRKTCLAPVSVGDLLRGARRSLLLGPLGSGKSTTLRLETRRGIEAYRAGQSDQLPVLLSLRKAAPLLARESEGQATLGLESLAAAAIYEWELDAEFHTEFRQLWYSDRLKVLLDGFDEISAALPRTDARRVAAELVALVERLPYDEGTIVIASRPETPLADLASQFVMIDVAPLIADESLDLLDQLVGQTMNRRVDLSLIRSLPPDLRSRPMFLVLLSRVLASSEADTPTSRIALLDASVRELLGARVVGKHDATNLEEVVGCSFPAFLEVVQELAFNSLLPTSEGDLGSSEGLDVGSISAAFLDKTDSVDVRAALSVLTRDSGLLVEEDGRLQYSHRVFQELLAANYLAEESRQRSFSRLMEIAAASPQILREVAQLVVERHLLDHEINCVLDLSDAALERAAALQQPSRIGPLVWLAAVGLQGLLALSTPFTRRDYAVVEAFRAAAPACVGATEALTNRERVEIARVLGQLGDPRDGVGAVATQPYLDWIAAAGGEFTVGLDDELLEALPAGFRARVMRERPARTVFVDDFEIARYPVTLGQFLLFVEAEDGYLNGEWWDADDPHRSARAAALAARGGQCPTLPAQGMDWYESVAFSRWLSAQLNTTISLPTEIEWERAARGESGWLYPWGIDFDPTQLNWEGAGLGEVVPVGCFTSPGNPWLGGPQDLLGNVWEWTLSIAGPIGSEEFAPVGTATTIRPAGARVRRVVRGGCYLNSQALLRNTYRGSDAETARYDRQGFRLVRHSP